MSKNSVSSGDFNYEPIEESMSMFSQEDNLERLTKEPTCFQNNEKPATIDLILTNKSKHFQHLCTFKIGICTESSLQKAKLKNIFLLLP